MAQKKKKSYEIRILRNTRAAGKSLAIDDVLNSPRDITDLDAYALLKMGKATPVSDTKTQARKTAAKKIAETR